MRVAIRPTLRVGDQAGTELEDLEVQPDHPHRLTRNDILNDNADLLAEAANILSSLPDPVRKFEVLANRNGAKLAIQLATDDGDFVDVAIDGRPRASKDVAGGLVKVELPVAQEFTLAASPVDVELRGYSQKKLVCFRRLRL